MRRWNMICPKCGQTVYYHPNCVPSTARDCNNHYVVVRRDGIKQFMHIKCPMKGDCLNEISSSTR